MKRVMLLGDSIRMGYEATVRAELAGLAEVWTSGAINGGSTAVTLAHLEEWLAACGPMDLIHVNCGLHDLARDFGEPQNRVPLAAYQPNVRQVLTRLRQTGAKLIWASTTPTHEVNHREVKGFDRLEADVLTYNAVAAEAANELGVPIDDLYSLIMREGRDRLLLPDGVHFAPEGSAVLGQAVAKLVRQTLEV